MHHLGAQIRANHLMLFWIKTSQQLSVSAVPVILQYGDQPWLAVTPPTFNMSGKILWILLANRNHSRCDASISSFIESNILCLRRLSHIWHDSQLLNLFHISMDYANVVQDKWSAMLTINSKPMLEPNIFHYLLFEFYDFDHLFFLLFFNYL